MRRLKGEEERRGNAYLALNATRLHYLNSSREIFTRGSIKVELSPELTYQVRFGDVLYHDIGQLGLL